MRCGRAAAVVGLGRRRRCRLLTSTGYPRARCRPVVTATLPAPRLFAGLRCTARPLGHAGCEPQRQREGSEAGAPAAGQAGGRRRDGRVGESSVLLLLLQGFFPGKAIRCKHCHHTLPTLPPPCLLVWQHHPDVRRGEDLVAQAQFLRIQVGAAGRGGCSNTSCRLCSGGSSEREE